MSLPLRDRDADAFAEIAAVEIGPAAECAAAGRGRAVEPERQRDAVAEQQVDLAALQRSRAASAFG